eukprot:403371582
MFVNPFFLTNRFPHVDQLEPETVLPVQPQESTKTNFYYRLTFNVGLITLFWLQHSIMAREYFKESMASITNGQYRYLDRPIFLIFGSFMLLTVMYNFMPMHEIAVDASYSKFNLFTSLAFFFIPGFYLFLRGQIEMPNDIYGFYMLKQIDREGNEFPLRFEMNELNRLQFMCRNPMVLGLMMLYFGSLCYGPVSYGRLLFVTQYMLAAQLGLHFQERELLKLDDPQYNLYHALVPNKLVPDVSVIFMIINIFLNQLLNQDKQSLNYQNIMAFVKPTFITWMLTHILQLFGFVLSLLSMMQLLLFLNPFFQTNRFPHVDQVYPKTLVPLQSEEYAGTDFYWKVGFNVFLVSTFWFLHCIMARQQYKEFMYSMTDGQYRYLERPIYTTLSAISLLNVIYHFKPIHEVAIEGSYSYFNMIFASSLIIGGLFIQTKSELEMVNDVYGFYLLRQFKKEGNEFPIPFEINEITRLQFLSRNPMLFGLMMIFIGSLLYGSVSYGRLLFVAQFIIAAFIGMKFEEIELLRMNDPQYMMYYTLVPNRIVPNVSVLFMSEESLNEKRQQILKIIN